MKNDAKFQQIFDEAMAAGRIAAAKVTPEPMIVGTPTTPFGNDIDLTKKVYYVPSGVCGFAWVNIKPGNSSFARWLKDKKLAHKDYYGGVSVWVHEYNQSMELKMAHAGAMAQVFNEHGIKAYANSRMD
jgi:hypothetical protein